MPRLRNRLIFGIKSKKRTFFRPFLPADFCIKSPSKMVWTFIDGLKHRSMWPVLDFYSASCSSAPASSFVSGWQADSTFCAILLGSVELHTAKAFMSDANT